MSLGCCFVMSFRPVFRDCDFPGHPHIDIIFEKKNTKKTLYNRNLNSHILEGINQKREANYFCV